MFNLHERGLSCRFVNIYLRDELENNTPFSSVVERMTVVVCSNH